jgi:glutamate-5-semialdehyde dehydrogenase
MIKSVETLASLPDPVGEIIHSRVLENGLSIRQVRSPLGVILVIFESRPNIIPEVFGLSFKAGNAVCLRGGSEAKSTNRVLYDILHSALETQLPLLDSAGTPPANRPLPFYGIDDYDRGLIGRLLQRSDIFDVCIPRGGDELIKRVSAESQIPIIKNDRGLCHLYIHEDANLDMALKIAINAKTQRPSVCNSIETIIIDRKIARDFFKVAIPALFELGVHFAGCEESIKILKNNTDSIAKTDGIDSAWASSIEIADARAFAKEYLDLKLNLKVVEGFELALHHIGTFGSKHSECIITQNEAVAREFLQIVDAACVYWNASTRFTDGFELGLGGEIGISTQKLHVRGPVGLRELTSARWIIEGHGEVRL